MKPNKAVGKSNPSLMKTVRYTMNGNDIEVIQRAGGLVTVNGVENPTAGRDYVDEEIQYLKQEGIPFEVYYTDYWTGEIIPIDGQVEKCGGDHGKFNDVPIETDTTIILQLETQIEGLDVLYQKWIWEKIDAESLIFAEVDLNGMDNQSLKQLVRTSPLVKEDSQMTVTRDESGFAFVNFNFNTGD